MKSFKLTLILFLFFFNYSNDILAQECFYGKCIYEGDCLTPKEAKKGIDYHENCKNRFLNDYIKKQKAVDNRNKKKWNNINPKIKFNIYSKDKKNISDLKNQLNKLLGKFQNFKVISNGKGWFFATNYKDDNVTLCSDYNNTNGLYRLCTDPNTKEFSIDFSSKNINYNNYNIPRYSKYTWKLQRLSNGALILDIRFRTRVGGRGGYRNWAVDLKSSRGTSGKASIVHTEHGKWKQFIVDLGQSFYANYPTKNLKKDQIAVKIPSFLDGYLILDPYAATVLHRDLLGCFQNGLEYRIEKSHRANSRSEINFNRDGLISCNHEGTYTSRVQLYNYYLKSMFFVYDMFSPKSDYTLLEKAFNYNYNSTNPQPVNKVVSYVYLNKNTFRTASNDIKKFPNNTVKSKINTDNEKKYTSNYSNKNTEKLIKKILDSSRFREKDLRDPEYRAKWLSFIFKVSTEEYIQNEETIYAEKILAFIDKGKLRFDLKEAKKSAKIFMDLLAQKLKKDENIIQYRPKKYVRNEEEVKIFCKKLKSDNTITEKEKLIKLLIHMGFDKEFVQEQYIRYKIFDAILKVEKTEFKNLYPKAYFYPGDFKENEDVLMDKLSWQYRELIRLRVSRVSGRFMHVRNSKGNIETVTRSMSDLDKDWDNHRLTRITFIGKL